jgi:hypothetical protein
MTVAAKTLNKCKEFCSEEFEARPVFSRVRLPLNLYTLLDALIAA